MSRPEIKLTAKQAAEVLTMEQIAGYFGICRDTFHSIMKRQEEVSLHYKKGKAKVINEIAQNLVTKARQGDLTAMIFFLKTQAGWRKKSELTHNVTPITPVAPEPKFDFSQLSKHERGLLHQLLGRVDKRFPMNP